MVQQNRHPFGENFTPFVDGAPCCSEGSNLTEVINPSTGKRHAYVSSGCDEDVNTAVESARRAYERGGWSTAPASFKKNTLQRLADLVTQRSTEFDALDAAEMGKPIGEKLFNAESAASLLRFYAEAVDKITGDVYSSDRDSLVLQRRVPRGVIAAIVPWNFPTFNAILKFAPALAAGNSVVLKPSELSSQTALLLAQLAIQAGVPPGVLNVVPGVGEIVGRALGLHMDVDMISFTGSTTVGKCMLQYSGQSNMKVVVAECGGKSPHIVFSDGVDLEAASNTIARSFLTNQGQICSAGSRLLVQRSIEEELVARIKQRTSGVVMGDALDQRTTFGPLASATQFARVMNYIDIAHAQGADLLAGGCKSLPDSGGFFIEPTMFRTVSPSARIAREEIFGPVLTVIPFDEEEEAICIANGTMYGLAAYVWTTSMSRGLRMAKGIRSSVMINTSAPVGEGAGHAISSEPSGQSGLGTEGGLAGMESFLRRQLIWVSHA